MNNSLDACFKSIGVKPVHLAQRPLSNKRWGSAYNKNRWIMDYKLHKKSKKYFSLDLTRDADKEKTEKSKYNALYVTKVCDLNKVAFKSSKAPSRRSKIQGDRFWMVKKLMQFRIEKAATGYKAESETRNKIVSFEIKNKKLLNLTAGNAHQSALDRYEILNYRNNTPSPGIKL